MPRWVLHDTVDRLVDMLWAQPTHKLPHVLLPKHTVIQSGAVRCTLKLACMVA
jgi:hypothetical protein